MRLSEAIRLGAMLQPKALRTYFPTNGGSCAMGAALDALGYGRTSEMLSTYESEYETALVCTEQMRLLWPWLYERSVVNPADGQIHVNVWWAIVELNDRLEWSREQIADWVATIEPSETPSVDGRADQGCGKALVDAVTV